MTWKVSDEKISEAVTATYNLTPRGIIEELNLLRPIYQPTAAYGHFGREPSDKGHFSWERLNKVDELKNAVG